MFGNFLWIFHGFSVGFPMLHDCTEVLALAVPLVTSIGFLAQQKEDGREEVLRLDIPSGNLT